MVETAAQLADHVMSRASVRQWVLSVPKRLQLVEGILRIGPVPVERAQGEDLAIEVGDQLSRPT